MKELIISLLLFFIVSTNSFSQVIKGTVKDFKSNKPLVGAYIDLLNGNQYVITNSKGKYKIKGQEGENILFFNYEIIDKKNYMSHSYETIIKFIILKKDEIYIFDTLMKKGNISSCILILEN